MKISTFTLLICCVILISFKITASELNQEAASAKIAAVIWLESKGYSSSGFQIEPLCQNKECSIKVYPTELNSEKYKNSRGCPLKVCATLTYSASSNKITQVVHWR